MKQHIQSRIARGIVGVRADAGQPDVKALVEGINQAFAEFKAANDAKIEALQKDRAVGDVTAKVEKIDAEIATLQAAIDAANLKMAAIEMAPGAKPVKDRDYTRAFEAHMRKGQVQAAASGTLDKGADSDGGYLAPVEWDRTITDKLNLVSPMRQIARVQPISTTGFSKLFNLGGTATGWVGEMAQRTQTATGTFGSLTYQTGELYANPAATQQMLDDAQIDLEAWLAGEVQTQFAKAEGAAFVSGDGSNKPTGFLLYATGGSKASTHPFGAIGVTTTGTKSVIKSDDILGLIYSLPSAFTGNARFVMNRATQGVIRALKDGQGNYLWQPSYVAGQPATLCGFPITEVPDMPDIADSALPIAFGDFAQGYLIVDRIGVRVLRDPFTNKPYVNFYTTKRVGGGLLDPEPLKVLKIQPAS